MRFRLEEEDNFSLELTPLIDVVFLLLIFFMVSTVFVDFKRRMDLSLPSSKSSIVDEAIKSVEIEMSVNNEITVNGKKVTLFGLERFIEKIDAKEKKNAIISADKDLPYGDVIKVMGFLQKAGIQDISVAVK